MSLMNKDESLIYSASISNWTELNQSFDKAVIRVAYPGLNRKKFDIPKEAFEASIQSIYNCPIVTNYDRDSDSLGGHDMLLIRKQDGSLDLVNNTSPIGVVPESAKYWWDTVTEENGDVHEYLYVEVLIWKRQEAYKKIKEDGCAAHSMEIRIVDGDTKDGIVHVKKFEFTALCLIGIEPCYESSELTFSMCKSLFEEMAKDLKESYKNMVTSSNDVDDKHPQKTSYSEGGNGALDKEIKKLAEQYGIDLDKIDFSLDGMSIDDVKAKFEEMKASADDNTGDTKGKTPSDTDVTASLEGDAAAITLETLTRQNAELSDKLTRANERVTEMSAELEALRTFKAQVDADRAAAEAAKVEADRAALFQRFDNLSGIEAFENLKKNCTDMSLEDIEDKCFSILGRNAQNVKFSMNESEPKEPKLPVDANKHIDNDTDNDPYGGVVEKYRNR